MRNFNNSRGGNRGIRGNRDNRGNRPNRSEGGIKNNFNQRRGNRGGNFNEQQNNVNLFILVYLFFLNQRNDRRRNAVNTRRFRGGKGKKLTAENLDKDLEGYWMKNDDACKLN